MIFYALLANATFMFCLLQDFELLCPDGRRAPYDAASTCNWGTIASHIVMTSAIRDKALRDQFKMLMKLIDWDFGIGGQNTDLFHLYLSVPYGKPDLMFSDVTMSLKDVDEVGDGSRNTYYTWVGKYLWLFLCVCVCVFIQGTLIILLKIYANNEAASELLTNVLTSFCFHAVLFFFVKSLEATTINSINILTLLCFLSYR